MPNSRARHPLSRAGIVLGVGLSMFFDGIVLHQLLQWHHMGSNRVTMESIEGLELNTLLDGLFHGAAWVVTVAGIVMLWRAVGQTRAPLKDRVFFGSLLFGFGAFNVFENILNHFILRIHHVKENTANVLAYDVVYLLVMGFLIAGVGRWLMRAPDETRAPVNLARRSRSEPRATRV